MLLVTHDYILVKNTPKLTLSQKYTQTHMENIDNKIKIEYGLMTVFSYVYSKKELRILIQKKRF